MAETLCLIASAVCMIAGLACVLLSVAGVFRFRFVLNRMHSASILDTLAIFLILLSLALAVRSMDYLPKLLLLLVFLWIGSPIASHLVSRLELSTDPEAKEHLKEEDRT